MLKIFMEIFTKSLSILVNQGGRDSAPSRQLSKRTWRAALSWRVRQIVLIYLLAINLLSPIKCQGASQTDPDSISSMDELITQNDTQTINADDQGKEIHFHQVDHPPYGNNVTKPVSEESYTDEQIEILIIIVLSVCCMAISVCMFQKRCVQCYK